jgi:2-amino-4-hydroxy-6-hydroxymethyldihydropteridine diphosphokinase
MSIAYVGLGSNLGQPRQQLLRALEALGQLPATQLQGSSPFYRSRAIGPGQQPDYINAVAQLETTISAGALLSRLQAIECAQGRERLQRWGPRTLDLDLLLYDQLMVQSPSLQIPHPRMRQRNFVVVPLHALCPELTLPDGTPLAALATLIDRTGLQRLDPDLARCKE